MCPFYRKKNEKNFLNIVNEVGCWSFIGKLVEKKPQMVSFDSNCIKLGYVTRELMHALGFNDEHNRPDRDEWTEIKENANSSKTASIQF